MFGDRVRRLRQERGLTQGELAALAGVSRQLIGSVEAGRHLPRVDAAAQLAAALGTSVEDLLATASPDVAGVTGQPPQIGAPLRLGRVGDRLVCARAGFAGEGWDLADGVLHDTGLELLPGAAPGTVAVGCDPALGLLERMVGRGRGPRLLAVAATTAEAVAALADGRAHAGVVHGPPAQLPDPPVAVRRWHLARWQVGLAVPAAQASTGWWRDALAGRRRVAQREAGAASQAAFEAAVARAGGSRPDGPVAAGHVDAAAWARREGLVAVTIEPAALAAGLAFHPLERHVAQLWVAGDHADEPGVAAIGDLLTSVGFRRRIEVIGGYDLSGAGDRVPA